MTAEIMGNAAKVIKSEPKYCSLTINPSRRELEHLCNSAESSKTYTREIMIEYAAALTVGIHGRPIKENAPFIKRIAALENQMQRGEIPGNIPHLIKELAIKRL